MASNSEWAAGGVQVVGPMPGRKTTSSSVTVPATAALTLARWAQCCVLFEDPSSLIEYWSRWSRSSTDWDIAAISTLTSLSITRATAGR